MNTNHSEANTEANLEPIYSIYFRAVGELLHHVYEQMEEIRNEHDTALPNLNKKRKINFLDTEKEAKKYKRKLIEALKHWIDDDIRDKNHTKDPQSIIINDTVVVTLEDDRITLSPLAHLQQKGIDTSDFRIFQDNYSFDETIKLLATGQMTFQELAQKL
jgi:N12 class adenine-specific DNA methylase